MQKWQIMRKSQVLRLFILLVALCQAHGDPSKSQEKGEVPVSQLRVLSLGLSNLLQGVEENAKRLEQRGKQVAAELDRATKSLESLHKHSPHTGRAHRRVRKDLQILSARGDRLWRAVRDLQKELDDLEAEQGATQYQMNQILQRLRSMAEPSLTGQIQLDAVSTMKVIIDKQARQLDSLTSEVSAQGRLIETRLHYIDRLEKQVSEGIPALRADSDLV